MTSKSLFVLLAIFAVIQIASSHWIGGWGRPYGFGGGYGGFGGGYGGFGRGYGGFGRGYGGGFGGGFYRYGGFGGYAGGYPYYPQPFFG